VAEAQATAPSDAFTFPSTAAFGKVSVTHELPVNRSISGWSGVVSCPGPDGAIACSYPTAKHSSRETQVRLVVVARPLGGPLNRAGPESHVVPFHTQEPDPMARHHRAVAQEMGPTVLKGERTTGVVTAQFEGCPTN
jgi:hypothetical protein